MRITVIDNETDTTLYEGGSATFAQQAVDGHAASLPGLHVYACKSNTDQSESAIDDEIEAQNCDVAELAWIAEQKKATILEIYMNASRSEQKAS